MSSLIIAAAGAGKTTFLVKQALEISENVLITTYTDANEQSIRDKFYEINGCIPSNVTIMPWFSLLIKHGIRPYQKLKIIIVYLSAEMHHQMFSPIMWNVIIQSFTKRKIQEWHFAVIYRLFI